MTARQRADERWLDPEPDLQALLAERAGKTAPPPVAAPTPDLTTDPQLLHHICDTFGIDKDIPLSWRLGALLLLGKHQSAAAPPVAPAVDALPPLSEAAADVLTSLSGCELTVHQLRKDTGRTQGSVEAALERLRSLRLVTRERRGRAWTYRATQTAAQLLRGAR